MVLLNRGHPALRSPPDYTIITKFVDTLSTRRLDSDKPMIDAFCEIFKANPNIWGRTPVYEHLSGAFRFGNNSNGSNYSPGYYFNFVKELGEITNKLVVVDLIAILTNDAFVSTHHHNIMFQRIYLELFVTNPPSEISLEAPLNNTPIIIPEDTRSDKPKFTKKTIPKTVKNQVWNEHNNPDSKIGKCFVCKCSIGFENFHCGHIEAESTGGSNTIDNLRPVCSLCNTSMGTQNLFSFMEQYGLGDKPTFECTEHTQIATIINKLDKTTKKKFIKILYDNKVVNLSKYL